MQDDRYVKGLNVYQVGGSVRDRLMGFVERDRDWVVVGSSSQELVALGFQPVGKDFTVFLHPETKEEYALARGGSIEEDLSQRDFTMNALALGRDGNLMDPFGGRYDIADRVIRHVGPAFINDPVRVLRGARFVATYQYFSVARHTQIEFARLASGGMLSNLQAERVWRELVKALAAPMPWRFFEVLRDCGALAVVFPEIDVLFGVPQPEEHHPEIDTGLHIMLVLKQIARRTPDTLVRFAALVHDLGKGITPQEDWPRHIGHEEAGVEVIKALAERLCMPNAYRDLGILVARWHTHVHRADALRPGTLLKLLEAVDAFKRPERLEAFLIACEADSSGRKGFEERPYPQADIVRCAFGATQKITAKQLIAEGRPVGPKLKGLLDQRRIEAMKAALPI